jgi:hypothetical protein
LRQVNALLFTSVSTHMADCFQMASITSTAGSKKMATDAFQLMETSRPELFHEWISRWQDLV